MKGCVGFLPGLLQRTSLRRLTFPVAMIAVLVVLAALVVAGCGSSSSDNSASSAASGSGPYTSLAPWTFDVTNVQPDGTEVPGKYEPVTSAKKSYKIAVLFPNVFDSYWTATNYGIVQEAERDHASMQLFDAGGYVHLSTQVTQLNQAIAQGYDAIIIGAISATGLNAGIKQAADKGIPVIDVINGIDSPDVAGHAIVSFYDLAVMTAETS